MRHHLSLGRFLCIGVLAALLASPVMAAKSTARGQLDTVIPSAKLTEIPLGDALDFVANITGANMVVDWKSLEAANISKQTIVNLNLHGVKGSRLLTMILNEAAGGDTLTWYIEGNVVDVTTKEISDAKDITVVYYVEDLIMMNMPFNALQNANNSLQFSTQISTGTPSAGGGTGTGTSNSSTFGQSGGQQGGTGSMTKQQVADGLIKLIENAIRPEVWDSHGGKATIDYFNGHLIVSAPRSVQEAIGGPLN